MACYMGVTFCGPDGSEAVAQGDVEAVAVQADLLLLKQTCGASP